MKPSLPRSLPSIALIDFSASANLLSNRFSKNETMSSLFFFDEMSPRFLDIFVSLHAPLGYPERCLPLR